MVIVVDFCVSSSIIRKSNWCVKFGLGTGLLLIFITLFLPVIEHSVIDTLELTSEMESRQNKKTSRLKKVVSGLTQGFQTDV